MRAALSIAVIVAINEWLDWPPIMEAALAALLTCLCDAGGPIRRRIPSLLSFAVIGACVTVLFGLVRSLPLGLVIPISCLGVFCTSFARVYGQAAMQVGNLLTVVLVLALRRVPDDVTDMAIMFAMFLAGSLWALLLTMVIWRLHPFLPARRAVARVYLTLASLAADLRHTLNHPAPDDAIWDRHARAHRRVVREAIEQARAAVLETVRARGFRHRRGAQSWIRLEAADQMFGALIGLSDLLADGPAAATRRGADRMLRRTAPMLVLLGRAIVTDAPPRMPKLTAALDAIAADVAAMPEGAVRRTAEAIIERLRIAVTLSGADALVPEGAALAPVSVRERLLGPIRANLDWNSAMLRHALRVAAVAAPAFAITLGWPGPYAHWLTITMVMTMQPYFALTFTRAVERIAGTMLGGVVAAVIATICTTPITTALALFPLAVMSLSLRAVSFALFITCLTPLVVLLSELGRPGEPEVTIALMRALFTLIGGALAVGGNFLLWPSWEPVRLAAEIGRAIRAHGAYARAEISALLGETPPATVEPARRAAGVASNNVEASLQRAILEPHKDDGVEAALTVDAALRRMAGRLSALHLDLARPHQDRAAWIAWRDWIDSATAALATGRVALPPRPTLPRDDPQADALVRIGRQLDLAAGALCRLHPA
jgi:uncharacterized membrane protein YccC